MSKLQEIVKDRELQSMGSQRVEHNLATEHQIQHLWQKHRGGKPFLSQRSRGHIFLILGTRKTLHIHEKAPLESKRREYHSRIGEPRPPVRPLGWNPKLLTYVGEGPGAGQVWGKKSDN